MSLFNSWVSIQIKSNVSNDILLVEVDFLPDVSQYPTNCLFPSTLTAPNGQPVQLYDNTCEGVVDLHFKWMQQYGIDGVVVQRFLSHLSDASFITVSLHLDLPTPRQPCDTN